MSFNHVASPDGNHHCVRPRRAARKKRMTRLLLIALLATVVSACRGSAGIVAPTPNPAATPHTPPAATTPTGWSVSIETTAVTGPSFCIHTPSVGMLFQGAYDVLRQGDTVSFVPPDPLDWDSFTGRVTGADFAATNPPLGSGVGMCTHYLQASDLVGTFSADANTFTAIEHWYFTLDSGDVKTVTFSWSGTRR